MGVMDNIRQRVLKWLQPDEYAQAWKRERLEQLQERYEYAQGNQRKHIKAKPGQPDDNIVINLVGLVIDRAVSMVVGGGVEFDLPGDDETPEQEYIDSTWDANNKDIALHMAAHNAAWAGTGYLRIVPFGIKKTEAVYHRIVAVDPRWVHVHTLPEDVDVTIAYETRFNITRDGEEVARREMVERESRGPDDAPSFVWMIRNYELGRQTGGQWTMLDETEWPYPFPPIVHWQNLPEPGSVYGASDVADVIALQDRFNFTASNISRIIRYHAHPKTWGRGVTVQNGASWGPDEMVVFAQSDAMLQNLEMQSDLASSAEHLSSLRQMLFDITRTVDITSLGDKIGMGNLTNFGIRVLFFDALAKLATKQLLMGAALKELNARLLVLGGFVDIEPGDVVWGSTIPTSDLEDLQAYRLEIETGLVSKQTVAGERGRDWEAEQERMEVEESGTATVDNLIRAFNTGGL